MIKQFEEAGYGRRILILDGGMGTMIQRHHLTESDYRGERFSQHSKCLKGNNDILVLTQPAVIESIHRAYIEAGADIIETCTFNANRISQGEYGLTSCIREMNVQAACIAKKAAQSTGRPCIVAGSIGPTNASLSMAVDVDHPEARSIDFNTMSAAYEEQIEALIEGGVDVILLETIFDSLNAKAALYALKQVENRVKCEIPVMISASLADDAGHLLNGQTLSAFVSSMRPYHPLSIGLNCSFGIEKMEKYLCELQSLVPGGIGISCYPNAGLPDETGNYEDDAEIMAQKMAEYGRHGYLNVAGGCCGTTPEHIAAIKRATAGIPARVLCPENGRSHLFSGLECVKRCDERFVIAERANVTGSKKFKRLIEQRLWEEALDTARSQMHAGAHLIDVCMDDAMLDAPTMMQEFLRRVTAEPEISQYPICLDSSDFEVIRRGLRECPGRSLVNSISLKVGEEKFLSQAREIRALGAAVVVMAFDEEGQATTTTRRIAILSRAVRLLIERVGFEVSDIAVDPNILAIGTGLEEHNEQAVSFIETCRAMREKFPGLMTVGGLSNLSFSFRGRDDIRRAIHRSFLKHAGRDLSMVIANPAKYAEPCEELAKLADELVENRSPEALEMMLNWMHSHEPEGKTGTSKEAASEDKPAEKTPAERLKDAFIHGISKTLESDIGALKETMSGLEIIEGPLMDAMNEVGDRFGRSEMILPQIVKAARLMKQAIGYLDLNEAEASGSVHRKKILLATVWGDVHDIGKNIVGIVLSCNGYEVIDLGVMVETDRIVREAKAFEVDAIGLSGLISPSLQVMEDVAKALKIANIHVPLLVGGAATGDLHTALKLAPAYAPGVVCHVADASRMPGVLASLLDSETRCNAIEAIENRHRELVEKSDQVIPLRSLEACRLAAPKFEFEPTIQERLEREIEQGLQVFEWDANELVERIDWGYVCRVLHAEKGDEGIKEKMRKLAACAAAKGCLKTRGHLIFLRARRRVDDIVLTDEHDAQMGVLYGFRVQEANRDSLCLADYVKEEGGAIGLFSVTTQVGDLDEIEGMDKEEAKLTGVTLSTALVEAGNEVMHERIVAPIGHYIKPAIGYPISPDHSQKAEVLRWTKGDEQGIELTSGYMMKPLASVCGMTLVHPEAQYFRMGNIGEDQWADYAARRGLSVEEVRRLCGK